MRRESRISDGIDTTTLANGEHSLTLDSIDASPANHNAPTNHSFGVDNQVPTVSLPGSVDVPGSGSTTYVTATATAGPSDVREITCTDDGSSAGSYGAPSGETTFSAQIPVSGLGIHRLSCVAQNNAANNVGAVATSAPAISTVSLREPTTARLTFAKVVDKEHCGRAKRGKRVCHPRMIRRRETVVVKRHGRKVKVHRIVRIVLLPHVVDHGRL